MTTLHYLNLRWHLENKLVFMAGYSEGINIRSNKKKLQRIDTIFLQLVLELVHQSSPKSMNLITLQHKKRTCLKDEPWTNHSSKMKISTKGRYAVRIFKLSSMSTISRENGILCLDKSDTAHSLTTFAKMLQVSFAWVISETGLNVIAISPNKCHSRILSKV